METITTRKKMRRPSYWIDAGQVSTRIKMDSGIDAKPMVSLASVICERFGITEECLYTKTRKREIVNARQVYVYILMTYQSYIENIIDGKIIRQKIEKGDRGSCSIMARHLSMNHATMLHCVKKVEDYRATEMFYKKLIADLIKGLDESRISLPNVRKPANFKNAA
jgi:hypothetical protein